MFLSRNCQRVHKYRGHVTILVPQCIFPCSNRKHKTERHRKLCNSALDIDLWLTLDFMWQKSILGSVFATESILSQTLLRPRMSVGSDHLLFLIAEHIYAWSSLLQARGEQGNGFGADVAGFKAPCYGSFCPNPALPPAEEWQSCLLKTHYKQSHGAMGPRAPLISFSQASAFYNSFSYLEQKRRTELEMTERMIRFCFPLAGYQISDVCTEVA